MLRYDQAPTRWPQARGALCSHPGHKTQIGLWRPWLPFAVWGKAREGGDNKHHTTDSAIAIAINNEEC